MSYFRVSEFLVFRGGGWTRTTELFRGQIYSLLQLPLCDFPLAFVPNWWEPEPMKGLEPPTGWLQISYSTNWVTSAFSACQTTLFLVNWGCKDTTFSQTHQNFFQLFSNIFHKQLIHISILRKKIQHTPLHPPAKPLPKTPIYQNSAPVHSKKTSHLNIPLTINTLGQIHPTLQINFITHNQPFATINHSHLQLLLLSS